MIGRYLLALALLVLPTIFPCLSLFGRSVAAILAAPLSVALLAASAGTAATLTGTTSLHWFVAGVVAVNLTAWFLRRRHSRPRVERSVLAESVVAGATLLPLLALQSTAIGWDARSIWLFHARRFYAGGGFVQETMGNDAFLFSHTDYPPLIPATVGLIWDVTGAVDLRLGQIVINAITFSAVALVGIALIRFAPPRLSFAAGGLGALLAVAAFGLAGPYGTNGYVDLLVAAGGAIGVLYLLVAPDDAQSFALGVIGAAVTGLTKTEGLVLVLVILAAAAVRLRRRRASVLLGAVGASLLVWPLTVRVFGGTATQLRPGALRALLTGDSTILSRVGPSLGAITEKTLPVFAAAALATLLVAALLRPTRRALSMGPLYLSWTATTAYFLSLLAAYVLSPHRLRWHLNHSINRTTILINLLLLSELMTASIVALSWLKTRRHLDPTAPRMDPEGRRPLRAS